MKYRNRLAPVLITNLCPHYRYKLFSILSRVYNIKIVLFDEPVNTREQVGHYTFPKKNDFVHARGLRIIPFILKNRFNVIIKCTNNKWLFLGTFIIAKLLKAKFLVWYSIWYYPKTIWYKLFSRIFLNVFGQLILS